ncbi:DUF6083 domain-containing protein [Streptomyces lavendulae]|uniref:DUF6083 domain-containing protein n=1 Tax=Streptomyces lavendulae TaxID=1914 RepID=UPI0033D3C71C
MSSKYADLGRLGHCWRCGDSVQGYPDHDGQEVVLDVREAPTHLVPEELRWRVNGNGIAFPLGWTDPTDTVRLRHEPVCIASPRPGPEPLRNHLNRAHPIARGHENVAAALTDQLRTQNRSPTSDDVRTVLCPRCEAEPDFQCVDTSGNPRQANHKERVAAFHQAHYDAFPVPQVAGQTARLLRPSRHQVRTIPCPRCPAPAGQPCTDDQGQPRTANHMERVDVYTSDT